MGTIQQKSLWFNIKLSKSLIFTPPTQHGIYELNSEEKHFQGRIPPNERPEIIRDLIQVCPAIVTKHISTRTLSQRAPILNCSASAISTELNASTNTTVALIVPDNPVINGATVKVAGLSNSDFEVDDTIGNDKTQEDYEIIPGTATMRNSVSSATSMSFADWEFLNVQHRLKTFMNEANIEESRKLKKWFLEFYETIEQKGSASANVRVESPVPCSSVDTNEIEIPIVSKTFLGDPTSQLTPTLAEVTPAAFPPISNEPVDNSVSESLMDDTCSAFNVEGLSVLYILDSTSIAEEIEVSCSDLEETTLLEDNNTCTFVIDISEATADPPQSSVQGSNCGVITRYRSQRVKSRSTCCQNVPLEIKKLARRQQETLVTSKLKTVTAKAKQKWHSCSYPSCNFKTQGLFTLKKHLGNLHFETPFECGKCDQKYRLHASLSKHLKTHEEKKLVCLIKNCSYKTHRSSHLKSHMMTHGGVKPFACKECNYKAFNSSNLKAHMRTHTGEKPFACKHCEFKASQNSNLKGHMMTHTDEKPFSCKRCEYRCRTKKHLKSHVSRRHGVKK